MTDAELEALARKLAAAFAGQPEGSNDAEAEFTDYREHWLRVAWVVLGVEAPRG